MSNMRWLQAVLMLTGLAAAWGCAAAPAADFTLREELAREWSREYVTFPLTAAQLKKAQALTPLLDDAKQAVPYQVIPGAAAGQSRIACQVDLAPLATRTFSFAASGKMTVTNSLQVQETPELVRISNGKTGVALWRTAAGERGPLAGVMLNSGRWVGTSRLVTDTPVTVFGVQVTARGPVMAEAVCRISFGDKGTWEARFRVLAGEPVVLVDEKSAVDATVLHSVFLSEGFNAEQLFFQSADSPYGKNLSWKIEDGLVFHWEPWLRWHASVRRGSTFSVYNAQDPDLLMMAAREAGAWVDPALAWEKQAHPPLNVLKDDRGLHADLPLKHGQRKWMLGALNRDDTLAMLADPAKAVASPLPYRYLIKYGHFPLDMIKDYLLRWPSKLEHPRLLMTRQDVERFKGSVADKAPYEQKAEGFVNNPTTITTYNMDDAIPAYLATGNEKLGQMLAEASERWLKGMVDYLIDQNDGLPFGAAPHHQQQIATAVGLADAIYEAPEMTPERRDRVRALAAFLGYTTARPEYWSTARGYAANPNMTTSVYGYQASLAAFVSDHPLAKEWVKEGMTGLKEQLDTWSDDNGGWLEAPHYAMVSYDQILAVLLMAYNAGFNDWLYSDPKVKTVIRWFAQIDVPPDSRIGGFRHRPAIGNTYMNEPCGEYGLLAYLFRDKDPQFSGEMQWQYKQNNSYGTPGIGGFFPAFAGYRKLLTDPQLPEKAPQYTSVLFPQTGVVLRDQYPSERETYLHMIAGDNHAHYDDDSGSVVLYGKGRILADEYGYYGYIPQEDHNMVESPMAGHGIMHVRDFVAGPRYDYVAGVKEHWTRQIAMVKGPSPEAPTYWVMNDALAVSGPAIWRMWMTAQEVRITGQQALVVGKEDVDMDVFFVTPQGVALKTEPKTRTSGSGMFPNWNWGPMETTQLGLLAPMERTPGYTTVLYPRLKTEKPPTVTPLAGGKAVKVEHSAGVDYVFLSATPFTYDEGDIHFEGLAGMAQLRGSGAIVAMGSGGKVTARGKTATSERPLPQANLKLFPNGDFEDGKTEPFAAQDNDKYRVSVYQGNPVAGDTTHGGRYCLAVTLKQTGGTNFSAGAQVPVDVQKVYRVRISAYADAPLVATLGGYGVGDKPGNVPTPEGQTWQWSLVARGPNEGWQRLETTIGPPGSGAPLAWPPGIAATHLTCWLNGEAGTLYLDDISFEPLD